MPAIANGAVSFDTVAREWRCKYTGPAGESASLEAAQKVLEKHLPALKALDAEVFRQVCGGCLDFKVSSPPIRYPALCKPEECIHLEQVSTALPMEQFSEWEKKEFSPEKDFLAELEKIDGVSAVETQTITFMKM